MKILKNIAVTVLILGICFGIGLVMQYFLETNTLIPAIFVLGAFLTALIIDGYIYGISSALLSVLAVNFAFTFPYFRFNFTITENLISAIIMIIVACLTCTLTTQIKMQKEIKAESEKEKLRANLLRAVSHDLRTPLTTISASADALIENYDSFSEEQKEKILKGISQDARWLSRMVENLLSITKLDSGNVKIIKTETVLDELIDSVLVKFSKRYPETEVSIDIPDEFITIPMDAILIEQVALNILENAVQHGIGMTELSLRAYKTGGKMNFEIKDNGCGIAEEKLKYIFKGYYTADSATSDVRKNNAGIGLTVCAAIIKAHGGEIKAENVKSGGCIFKFTLSMEEEDE